MNLKNFIFILLLIGCVFAVPGPKDLQELAAAVKPAFVMVVDAGHGGPDGGAEAADGTKEKDLNLSIAKAVKEEGEKYGIQVMMTRSMDEGLYEKDNVEKQWKKLGDLKERRRIIEESRANLVVSIHLNSFWGDTSVRGAQVFYPESGDAKAVKESEELADLIQQSLIQGLNDGSNRIEMAKNDIYIFKDIQQPTVLVECGFLSNTDETKNLKSKTYQKQLAEFIVSAVAEYFGLTRQNVQKISTS